jgi:hypothetical protein
MVSMALRACFPATAARQVEGMAAGISGIVKDSLANPVRHP